MKKLKIDSIITAELQARVTTDEDTVDRYAEQIKEGAKFPPVTVFYDGKDYFLADGSHRLAANLKQGETHINAEVKKGGQREALLFACGANQRHGLPRTRADINKAIALVCRLLPKAPDRELARIVGVHHYTIGLRRRPPGSRPPKPSEEAESANEGGQLTNTESAAAAPETEQAPPPPPKLKVDEIGRTLPPDLVELYARRQELLDLAHKISEVRVQIRKAQDANDPAYFWVNHSSVLAELDQSYAHLKGAVLHALCPTCHGKPLIRPKCTLCHKTGLVGAFFWDRAVPEEKKAFILKSLKP
jgi:uncharacterized ParB-like nuclease family protein